MIKRANYLYTLESYDNEMLMVAWGSGDIIIKIMYEAYLGSPVLTTLRSARTKS